MTHKNKIREALKKAKLSTGGLAERFGVTKIALEEIRDQLIASGEYSATAEDMDPTPPESSDAVHFGSRTQPYHASEADIGVLPTYHASNRERITPLNPNWKLYGAIN